MKRKTTFTIRSVAGTSDNASEIADSIILPGESNAGGIQERFIYLHPHILI
jgi:hypothetical protein